MAEALADRIGTRPYTQTHRSGVWISDSSKGDTARSDHQEGMPPVAFVYERAGDQQIVDDLTQIGWKVRAVDRADLGRLAATHADLWIVSLGSSGSDACAFLRLLCRFRIAAPLLVIVDTHQLHDHGHELARLLSSWPAASEAAAWPYTREEFQFRVLRLRTAQTSEVESGRVYELGALYIDTGTREASFCGESLQLRPVEFNILLTLVAAKGRIVSKTQLAGQFHGSGDQYGASAIEVYVSRLRNTLAAAGLDTEAVLTVRGAGYRLQTAKLECPLRMQGVVAG